MKDDTSWLRDVKESEKSTCQRDGVALLKAIYPGDWVATLTRQLDDVFAQSAGRSANLSEALLFGNATDRSAADRVKTLVAAASSGENLAIEEKAEDAVGVSFVETDASNWQAGMRDHNHRGALAKIIHQLTNSECLVFYSDQLFFKDAGSRVKTPCHQDKPYFLVDGGEMAVAWVPMETGTFPEIGGIDHTGLDTLDHSRLREEDIIYFDA